MPKQARDGVGLAYERREGGGRPVVLIHGWCCDRSFFAPQAAFFAGLGHDVLSPDLRGHGESDAPRTDYLIPTFADDVAWLCRELGVESPLVVGHSMGGVVAFDLAVRYPGLAGAVAMIDSPVTRPPASRAGMPAFLERLRGPDWRVALADYAGSALFLPTDDPARKAALLGKMGRAQQHVVIGAFEGLRDFDPGEAAGRALPPALFIASDGRPLSEIPRLLTLAPALHVGQTVGSGHFCQLEVPDQVNAMLARFLALVDRAA